MGTNGTYGTLSTRDLVRYAAIGLELEQARINEAKQVLERYATGEPERHTEVKRPVGRPRKQRGNGAILSAHARTRKARKLASIRMKQRWAEWRRQKAAAETRT